MKKIALILCIYGLTINTSNAQNDRKAYERAHRKDVMKTNNEEVKSDAQYRRDHLQKWEEPKVNYTDTTTKHPSLIAPPK